MSARGSSAHFCHATRKTSAAISSAASGDSTLPADEPENGRVAVFVYSDERQFTIGKHGIPLISSHLGCIVAWGRQLSLLFPVQSPGVTPSEEKFLQPASAGFLPLMTS